NKHEPRLFPWQEKIDRAEIVQENRRKSPKKNREEIPRQSAGPTTGRRLPGWGRCRAVRSRAVVVLSEKTRLLGFDDAIAFAGRLPQRLLVQDFDVPAAIADHPRLLQRVRNDGHRVALDAEH